MTSWCCSTRPSPGTTRCPQPQWNGKVLYSYGASTGQPRLQFRTEQNWADNTALSRGFMVVDNSLTDSLYNSNRVLVAETTMMMKEHIVDSYGEIKYMMGNGCSGGSIQQNTVASIFPGLLDGIQPVATIPIRSPPARRSGLRAVGQRLRGSGMDRADEWPDTGSDQRQEDGDQWSSRPRGLPVVEQRLRVQQQTRQLRAHPGLGPNHRRAGHAGRVTQ